ncbi:class I SAM-dependent methyltransferase [Oricola thermophila]|uniref:Class I SAM-dependent methyltransferase n=1 Tax=Oricola thermophila TaxID=2742145 RepID=A0A6N1VJZ0_9HYPH|nr:class I SAM-dependent methyltransferase [Oricola thermophila]QKV19529.1 class I SAM-dependent methyltransferase [Oricola thermophila]
MSGAVDTLFIPFATGDIALPGAGQRIAFLNAAVPDALPEGFDRAALLCEQGFRPAFLALERAGYAAVPVFDGAAGDFAAALVLAGKHKGENRAMIARACGLAAPDGTVAVAGDKTLGIQPLRKWTGDRVAIEGSLAKHHATVFSFAAPRDDVFSDMDAGVVLVDGRFETAPGMFSHARPDPGSVLLARHIDERITGDVADFGAGWGYLASHVLERSRPASLAMFEAHYPSLKAAERNVGPLAPGLPVSAHWRDLAAEPVARRFDWVVMNPPFHSGRAAEPDIGRAFIAAASNALKPGGRLLMVANRKLPYEQALAQGFRRVAEKDVEAGYKVIEAVR